MNIEHILKRSWELTWKHKFLWIFGAFAGGSSLPGNFWNIPMGGPMDDPSFESLPEGAGETSTDAVQALLGISKTYAGSLDTEWNGMPVWLIAGGIALFVLVIYLSVTFTGGLLSAVAQLDGGKRPGFQQAWAVGRSFFWRYLILGLYLGVVALASLLIIGVPVFVLISLNWTVLGIVLGVLGALVFVPWMIVLGVVGELSARALILDERPILESVRHAFSLLRKQPGNVALLWLVHSALGVGAGVLFFVLFLILMGLALLGGFAAQIDFVTLMGDPYPSAYAIVLMLIGAAIILPLAGITGSFLSAYWTLGYRELTK